MQWMDGRKSGAEWLSRKQAQHLEYLNRKKSRKQKVTIINNFRWLLTSIREFLHLFIISCDLQLLAVISNN